MSQMTKESENKKSQNKSWFIVMQNIPSYILDNVRSDVMLYFHEQ